MKHATLWGAAWILIGWTLPFIANSNDVPAGAPVLAPKPPLQEVASAVEAGRALRNAGNDAEAIKVLEKALTVARQAKDQAGESLALNNIASIYRYQAGLNVIAADQKPPADLIKKSADLYQQALTAAFASGSKFNIGYAQLYLGVLESGRNDSDKAFKNYEAALATFKEIDNRYYMARTHLCMGATALYRRQQPEAALKHFEQALPLFREAKIWHEAQLVVDDMATAYGLLIAQAKPQR